MKVNSAVIVFSLVLISGCSTLNEQECRTADWYRLGARDGQQGEQASLLDEHRESCKQYGIPPDEHRYHLGRVAGLKQYCRLDNAFRLGMKGTEYTGVCPMEVDADFRRYNAAALDVSNSRKKIEEIDRKLAHKEHELGEGDTPKKEKIRLRAEVRDLDRMRDRTRSDLYFQERELERLMDDERRRRESK